MGCKPSALVDSNNKNNNNNEKEETANATCSNNSTNNSAVCCGTNAKQSFTYRKNTCALEYWEPIRLLGEGSISSIHLVRRRPERVDVPYQERADIMRAADTTSASPLSTKEERDVYALKSIMKDHVRNDRVLEEMRKEIYTMSRLCHPNIVEVVEAFERKRHIYLIMEYCRGGDLNGRQLSEPEVAVVIRKVLQAVAYMHSHNVVHRDLKLENIMFDKERFPAEIKIIDFGLATKFLSNEYKQMTAKVGTLYSMAPQVLQGVYDSKCDIWSIGVITYMLLSGLNPFRGPPREMSWEKRKKIMIDRIMRCEYMKMKGPSWDPISKEAKEFVQKLLQMVPRRRPTAKEALELPWIQKHHDYETTTMPAQNIQYKLQGELKRKLQVLLAHALDEDDIVSLNEALQKHDNKMEDAVSVQHLQDALLQTKLTLSQVTAIFDHNKELDKTASISYVSMLKDTLDRKLRKQEESIANMFPQCGPNVECSLPRSQVRSMLAGSSVISSRMLDIILDDLAEDDNEPISCQTLLGRLKKFEMDRMGAINSCRPLVPTCDCDGQTTTTAENDDGGEDDDERELVDETNAVIPGGRKHEAGTEPAFIYDDSSKAVRRYRHGEDVTDSIISL